MNEQNEIMGDWYEGINEEAAAEAKAESVGIDGYEAEEAAELAPEPKPLSDFAGGFDNWGPIHYSMH